MSGLRGPQIGLECGPRPLAKRKLSVWNGHYERTCYYPLFRISQNCREHWQSPVHWEFDLENLGSNV